jgi:AcrR family transcriptional regulator
VVRDVLDATIEELGRVGFAALRVEDVADRAGVNKTTVYRRWPTKAALVQASFEQFGETVELRDTGSLRGDLLDFIRQKLELGRTPQGKALMRGLQAEAFTPELLGISRRLRKQEHDLYARIFERGRARNELRPGVDDDLLMSALEGAFMQRYLFTSRLVTDAEAAKMVDLVLLGALSREVEGPGRAVRRRKQSNA